jgi:hypothetical protein
MNNILELRGCPNIPPELLLASQGGRAAAVSTRGLGVHIIGVAPEILTVDAPDLALAQAPPDFTSVF